VQIAREPDPFKYPVRSAQRAGYTNFSAIAMAITRGEVCENPWAINFTVARDGGGGGELPDAVDTKINRTPEN